MRERSPQAKRSKKEDDWPAQWEAQRAQARATALANLANARKVLASLKVKTVTVIYDGYSDEGSIENVEFTPMPKSGVPSKIELLIGDAVSELLPEGWENGNGACGTVEIDVKAGKVRREHSWRVEAFETEKEVLDL